jgi:peptide/nickel transport system ATP-binding protein
MATALLEVRDLKTWLMGRDAPVRAVDGVGLTINHGETYALVGESGCGKSMTALSIARLLPENGQVRSGTVHLAGTELLVLAEASMREVRGKRIGMIFQEPGTSLNPVLTVGTQIGEVIRRHTLLRGARVRDRCVELLDSVGIPDASRRLTEFPFQLSGGMKQRVMIAAALACDPELLIADEPTTALDVTIQAQVIALLKKLQSERNMSILLITHDLAVVAQIAHKVGIMYAGQIVEQASRQQFFESPAHPYSRKLFESLPRGVAGEASLAVIPGNVPSMTHVFSGCRFAERCDLRKPDCDARPAPWVELGHQHQVRCVLQCCSGQQPVVLRQPPNSQALETMRRYYRSRASKSTSRSVAVCSSVPLAPCGQLTACHCSLAPASASLWWVSQAVVRRLLANRFFAWCHLQPDGYCSMTSN